MRNCYLVLMMNYKLLLNVIFLVAPILLSHAAEPTLPTPSAKERVALLKEAEKAINAFVHIELKERDGEKIPRRLWGATMVSLKPVRVMNDHVNVKIVLADTEQFEAGYYVRIPISSFAPRPENFDEFIELSQPEDNTLGSLFRYRLAKGKPSVRNFRR